MTDPLGELLAALEVSATHLAIAEFTAPWGLTFESFAPAFLYAVVEGNFIFETAGIEPLELGRGDLLLTTRPLAACNRSDRDAALQPLDQVWAGGGMPTWSPGKRVAQVSRLRYGGGGAKTRLITIVIETKQEWAKAFFAGLPSLIHIAGPSGQITEWLETTLEVLLRPAGEEPGNIAIALRLAELVVVSALRTHLAALPRDADGWLRAILDPQLCRAVAAIQAEPGVGWTVDALARTAGMSRSSFARRFSAVVGTPPHEFLAAWRMRLAADWLSARRCTAQDASRKLGYSTPSAFGQAFRSHFGMSPYRYARTTSLRGG